MNGLVAYLDILGYQSFLENNPNAASETAEKVLDLIAKTPESTKVYVLNALLELQKDKTLMAQVSSALRHIVFSDTILLSIEYPNDVSEDWKFQAFLTLISLSSFLFVQMFKGGLPLRGAMVEGEFISKDYCFAGQAIIDAYKITKTLNVSGVVCQRGLLEHFIDYSQPNDQFVNYVTPISGLKEEKMFHFNW